VRADAISRNVTDAVAPLIRGLEKLLTEKAPQVGLEPTTLRLTEGFHIIAGSYGLLPTHSSFCIYRLYRLADMRSSLLRFAGCCLFKTAKQTARFRIFHRASRRRRFETVLQNSFADSPRPAAILARDFLRSLCSRGDRARTKLSTSSSSTGETRTATALPLRVMATGPSVCDSSMSDPLEVPRSRQTVPVFQVPFGFEVECLAASSTALRSTF